MSIDCYPCQNEAAAVLPSRESIVTTEHWRVAHAFNSTLPGWLVVVPRSHITAFADLSPQAAAELGGVIRDLSAALKEVTGCVKTYVMQFAEAEGFEHLHVHVVPRAADLPADLKGPRIFGYLTDDEARWLPSDDLDALAAQLRRVAGFNAFRTG